MHAEKPEKQSPGDAIYDYRTVDDALDIMKYLPSACSILALSDVVDSKKIDNTYDEMVMLAQTLTEPEDPMEEVIQ
jgi:hypothetical protein